MSGKYITGTVTPSINNQYGSRPSFFCKFNGKVIDGNGLPDIPIYNPSGVFSKPMAGRWAVLNLTPHGTTGYISGFANEMPDPANSTNNVSDLQSGEIAICETSNFNYNIQAKLDGLKSKFKNLNNDIITSNIGISENIVTILTDLIEEVKTYEANYNNLIQYVNKLINTVTTSVQSGGGVPLSSSGSTPISPYTATPNFTRDDNFINSTPSKMYINDNGEIIA